jgi:hypothetical protein
LPIKDVVPINICGSDTPSLAENEGCFSTSDNGNCTKTANTKPVKKLGSDSSRAHRSSTKPVKKLGSDASRAQRVTPAVMNAMAMSYQQHFEAFCKGS